MALGTSLSTLDLRTKRPRFPIQTPRTAIQQYTLSVLVLLLIDPGIYHIGTSLHVIELYPSSSNTSLKHEGLLWM